MEIFKKKIVKSFLVTLLFMGLLWFVFMSGRYSYLITKPSFLFNKTERLCVNKARAFVKAEGIGDNEPLEQETIKHVVVVNFMYDHSNYEVTVDRVSGEWLNYFGN